jgi:hypothetical protein
VLRVMTHHDVCLRVLTQALTAGVTCGCGLWGDSRVSMGVLRQGQEASLGAGNCFGICHKADRASTAGVFLC